MIYAVTGSPGSGKSFYTVRVLADALASGKVVATNATLLPDWSRVLARTNPIRRLSPSRVQQQRSRYERRLHYTNDIHELQSIKLGCSVCGARRYDDAGCGHSGGYKEGRGVAVLDEAHEWLNNRSWKSDDRDSINAWFAEHRKRGWDVYLITQHLDSIDKQVRDRVEWHVRLRNLNNLKIAGVKVVPIKVFLAIHVWAAGPRASAHVGRREVFTLDSRRKLYNSWALVHDGHDVADDQSIWLPRAASRPARQAAAGGAAPAAASSEPSANVVDVTPDVTTARANGPLSMFPEPVQTARESLPG